MEKEFIPYEQALALTELGFDEPCFGFYLNGKVRLDGKIENCLSQERVYYVYSANCLSPTFSQAFRFFREKYSLKFYIRQDIWNHWCSVTLILNDGEYDGLDDYETYEEAELECLKKLIEIVKEKK